jgi:hypothetical protein
VFDQQQNLVTGCAGSSLDQVHFLSRNDILPWLCCRGGRRSEQAFQWYALLSKFGFKSMNGDVAETLQPLK